MSSSCECSVPVMMLKYRDMKDASARDSEQSQPGADAGFDATDGRKDVHLTKAEFAERIARERASAASEAEQRLRSEYEKKLLAARASIATALTGFEQERDKYYAKVEAEIVQLALAIAAKILHREHRSILCSSRRLCASRLTTCARVPASQFASVPARERPGKSISLGTPAFRRSML